VRRSAYFFYYLDMEEWKKQTELARRLLGAGQQDHALVALLRAWKKAPSNATKLQSVLNATQLFEHRFGVTPHYTASLLNDEQRRGGVVQHALRWLSAAPAAAAAAAAAEGQGGGSEVVVFGEYAFWIGVVLEQLSSDSSSKPCFEVVANIDASSALTALGLAAVGGKASPGWKVATPPPLSPSLPRSPRRYGSSSVRSVRSDIGGGGRR
jgi:hypothetical protein